MNRTIETDRRRPACITDRGCLIRALTMRVTTLLLLLSLICLTPSQLFSAGEKIAIKQFTANPPSFYSPEKGPMSLSVVADVDRCCGLSGNGSFRFFLRWTFNFNQGTTTVRTLTGETEFSNSGDSLVSVPFSASFDGRDSAGNFLAEGGFSILLATDFVRVQYAQDGTYKSERIFSSITYEPGGFTVDRTSPVIQISAPVEGFSTKSNVTVTFSATDANLQSVSATLEKDGGSPVPVTSGSAVTENGEYKLKVLASDKSGNTSEAERNFEIDKIGPVIQITSPANGTSVNASSLTVTGTAIDPNGVATVTVNGISATLSGDSFTVSPVLLSRLGNSTISVVAADQVGNSTTASTNVNLDTAAPVISNVSPADDADINSLTVTVSGTVSDNSAVSTVLVNGTTATLLGNSFSTQVEFGAQGNNSVFIIATDDSGNNGTQILSYRVITGVHPPVINPKPPAVTNQNPITIAGTADPGTSIRIAGGAVDQTVPLDTGTFSIQYTLRENQVNSITISAVSGSEESIPETFEITHDNIAPKKPEFLNYTSIIKSSKFGLLGITDEIVTVFMDGLSTQQQTTSSPGNGAFGFQLDIPPNQTVNVSIKAKDAAGNESEVTPAQIRHDPTRFQNLHIALSEPRNWTAVAGTVFPHPLEIILTDQNGDAVQGYPIVFDVVSGDGLVEGQTTMTKHTNSAGHAFVYFALGPVPGQYNNIVRATFTDNIEAPALLQITGLAPKAGEPTTVEGVVLDENFGAVPGATIILMRDGFNNLSMLSDETGRFTFENVEPGRYHLRADGTTTTLPQQRYPVLAYEIDVFEGQVNTIGMPIFLPRTQVENKLDITGTTSQVYTTPAIAKLKVNITPGAITYPDGSHTGEFIISPVPIEVLPMPLPNGWATSLAISIQPAGTVFNPPLPITFPNVDGAPAGSKATIVSFDHGAGRYILVGDATVSADGATVTSDPGNGIKFGAWHAIIPPETDSCTTAKFAVEACASSGEVMCGAKGIWWTGPFPTPDPFESVCGGLTVQIQCTTTKAPKILGEYRLIPGGDVQMTEVSDGGDKIYRTLGGMRLHLKLSSLPPDALMFHWSATTGQFFDSYRSDSANLGLSFSGFRKDIYWEGNWVDNMDAVITVITSPSINASPQCQENRIDRRIRTRMLQQGHNGDDVIMLQGLLRTVGISESGSNGVSGNAVAVNGTFSNLTQVAVIRWQTITNGVPQTGSIRTNDLNVLHEQWDDFLKAYDAYSSSPIVNNTHSDFSSWVVSAANMLKSTLNDAAATKISNIPPDQFRGTVVTSWINKESSRDGHWGKRLNFRITLGSGDKPDRGSIGFSQVLNAYRYPSSSRKIDLNLYHPEEDVKGLAQYTNDLGLGGGFYRAFKSAVYKKQKTWTLNDYPRIVDLANHVPRSSSTYTDDEKDLLSKGILEYNAGDESILKIEPWPSILMNQKYAPNIDNSVTRGITYSLRVQGPSDAAGIGANIPLASWHVLDARQVTTGSDDSCDSTVVAGSDDQVWYDQIPNLPNQHCIEPGQDGILQSPPRNNDGAIECIPFTYSEQEWAAGVTFTQKRKTAISQCN